MNGQDGWAQNYKDQKLFLGKECKVYQSPEGEAYFWNGILLRQETTKHPMGGRFNVTKEAVDIKLNVSIPDDRFEVPSGIKVMTPEETVGDMERMLEDLKDIKKEDLKRMKKDIEKIGGK